MSALFVLWFLFGGFASRGVDCGITRNETIPIYAPVEYTVDTDKGKIKVKLEQGQYLLRNGNGTTTVLAVNGTSKIIGEVPNKSAIDYNKKVKECQIANGQF